MNSGKSLSDSKSRLARRIYIYSHLDDLIKESVYYRTHSDDIDYENKFIVGNINNKEIKAKII